MPVSQIPEKVSRQDRELLILHLIRSQKVIASALNKFKPEHFNETFEEPFQLLWAISSEYFTVHSQPIPRLILDSLVFKYLEQDPNLETFRNDILGYVDWSYSLANENFVDDYILTSVLQPLIDERIVMPLANQSNQTAQETVTALTSAFNSTRVNNPEPTKLFDLNDPSLYELDLAAVPTGAMFFDTLIGGVRKGHITGLLAPSGGGKTTGAISVAVGLAKQRKYAVIFHYEQAVGKQLRPRIWSAATGIPTSEFTKVMIKDLPPGHQKAINDNSYIDQYFIIYDMTTATTGNGGIVELDSILQGLKYKGIEPELVVIDWLGPLVKKYCISHGLDLGRYMLNTYNDMLTSCKYNIALKYNTELLITHQLNADAGKKGPGSIPSMYDAAEFKQFANLMDTCMLIGRMDENKIARMFTDKNRGAAGEIFVQLQDDIPNFNVQNQALRAVMGPNGRMSYVNNQELGQGWA